MTLDELCTTCTVSSNMGDTLGTIIDGVLEGGVIGFSETNGGMELPVVWALGTETIGDTELAPEVLDGVEESTIVGDGGLDIKKVRLIFNRSGLLIGKNNSPSIYFVISSLFIMGFLFL